MLCVLEWENVACLLASFCYIADDMQQLLVKHLLKTLCTDLTNSVFQAFATDSMVTTAADSEPTPEVQYSSIANVFCLFYIWFLCIFIFTFVTV